MGDEYVDTLLINCSRKSGVEARSGNESEAGVWTNTLQSAIRLEVGDKVEMESVFINEIGSANAQTIEFSGKAKGTNFVPTYTKTEKKEPYTIRTNAYDAKYRLGKYRKLVTTEISGDTLELRDTVAPFIYGYYITSSEYPNYITQPRCFASAYTRNSFPQNTQIHKSYDSTTDGLIPFSVNDDCFVHADWVNYKEGGAGLTKKQVLDNSRFTLFVKDTVFYDADLTDAETQFPKKSHNGIFSEANYIRVRDRLDLTIDAGFNTPSAVAEQITRQLTETTSPEIFDILDGAGFVQNITKTVSSNTYKPMECINYFQFDNANYTLFRNVALPVTSKAGGGASANTQLLTDYISSFAYIGIKRPEIYETGRTMARTVAAPAIMNEGDVRTPLLPDPDDGFQVPLSNDLTAADPRRQGSTILTNIPYTQANLSIIRDFLDAQALYPELWENIRNTKDYDPAGDAGGAGQTDPRVFPEYNTSRFFHMNKYKTTASAGTINTDGFGSDNYQQRAAPNNINHSSGTVFFEWQEANRDLYIPPEQFNLNDLRLNYGFAIPFNIKTYVPDGAGGFTELDYYVIRLNTSLIGIPRSLFTDVGSTIGVGRRIGFDFHATAFSTAIVSPYSGKAVVDIGTIYKPTVGDDQIAPETVQLLRDSAGNNRDLSPYFTQTYIGANNPELTYNTITNRFELVKLHTSNNAGNTAFSGNPATNVNSTTITTSLALKPPGINAEAGDTVYKINPKPSQLGYTPNLKPYASKAQQAYRNTAYPANLAAAVGANSQYIQGDNLNINPYTIYDSHGGIYIDYFGYSEDNWEDNLFDILGFRYEAVQAKPSKLNVLTKRVNNDNKITLYRPTTNAEVVSTDTKAYFVNRFGANMYQTGLSFPYSVLSCVSNDTVWVTGDPLLSYHPEVVIRTESMAIPASDIQKSVLKPYYAIRSSILEGYTTIGGSPTGALLPIISVVDKYSAQGDFYFGKGNVQYTVTKPTVIADITTAITDPDGEISNCDNSSAIVYKVTKVKKTPENILEMIFKNEQKEQKDKK